VNATTTVRGVQGAITVECDEREAILSATERLLKTIVAENHIDTTRIASALFSATPDLRAAFPAAAAHRIGWIFVPLLSFAEIDVAGGLARCVRVLVHLNTGLRQDRIVHVFLEGARVLRPDLVKRSEHFLKTRHL
jgi:chorismate mutase